MVLKPYASILLRVASCIVLIYVAFYLLVDCALGRMTSGPAVVNLQLVNADIQVQFPQSSHITHTYIPDRFIDPIWYARIEVPVQSAQAVLAQLRAKPIAQYTRVDDPHVYVAWWTPADVTETFVYDTSTLDFVYIVVTQEAGVVVFYIEHAVI